MAQHSGILAQTSDAERPLALLIDGDNAQPSLLALVLAEAARHGIVSIRRIYGDWTTPQMSGWKTDLHTHAVQPVQQFRYTTGKNSTDSALIIDAMDLLHSGSVGGFCIVSSDSDYTRLATRIREHGLFVMGIGRSNTPEAFVNACAVFVSTENLTPKEKSKKGKKRQADGWTETVAQAVDAAAQDDGWAFLGTVGQYVRQLDPAFDPRSFGHKQLSLLIKSRLDLFETRETKSKGGPSVIYVKPVG